MAFDRPSLHSMGEHAFASAPVFARPKSLWQAIRMVRAMVPASGRGTGRLLWRIWSQFTRSAEVGDNVQLGLKARAINLSAEPARLKLRANCVVRGILRVEKTGELCIGSWSYIGDDTILSSQTSIRIGEGTLLAHGVQVFDNSSHPINPYQRQAQFMKMLGFGNPEMPLEIDTSPVQIGNRCWLGMNTIVMRGVSIGDNCVVAAGSVVTRSMPAGTVCGGNPCQVLRELTPAELSADGFPQI